jgi:asparagine synthase (glutamine-hydrolysing)
MCGILAIYSLKSSPIAEEKILSGLDVLRHRGPDNISHWTNPNQQVRLGHARLSIIDLHTGNQPLANGADMHLIANGEFYDFETIRDELIAEGYSFSTASDSEIALHLYSKQGTGCLRSLRGEFAFCLWDGSSRTLFAARDRFGIKPLFYTVHNDILYLASEVKALFAAGVPAVWDTEAYTSRAFMLSDRTLFSGVHQIPPGSFMLASRGGIRIQRYWDFSYPLAGCAESRDEGEIIKDVRECLLQSIRTRLRADVPVGVYLSGGVDSCSLLAMASTLRQDPFDAFTLSFDENKDYDEVERAAEMASRTHARFHVIPVRQVDLADHFSDAIWHNERPCLNAHLVGKFLLSKAVRQYGCPVVLTGEGADEIGGGYAPFRRDMILYHGQHLLSASEKAQRLQTLEGNNKISAGGLLPACGIQELDFTNRYLGFTPSWLLPQAEIIATLAGLYAEQTLQQMATAHPFQNFLNHLDVNNQLVGRDPVHISMYLLAKSILPNYVLSTLGDRMEMAHSIEGRLPYLDHNLVEKVVALPVSYKIRGMTEKWILREAARPYLPADVYQREKQPFLAPPAALSPKGKLFQMAEDLLRGDALRDLPFYNQKKIISYLDLIPRLDVRAQTAAEPVLMELTSMVVLQQRFQVSSPANSGPSPS